MMADILFYVKAFIGLFVLVNPLEGIPVFLAGTRQATPEVRDSIARRASVAVTITLLLSTLLGNAILRLFGIGIAAFQLGGGAILFLIAIRLVFGSGVTESAKTADGAPGQDFAIVPLAIPLMAGPGAITGAILYGTRTHSFVGTGILVGVIVVVGLATWASLRGAGRLGKSLKETGITVATSVMGLIIAAIAAEMMGNGIALMFGIKMLAGVRSI